MTAVSIWTSWAGMPRVTAPEFSGGECDAVRRATHTGEPLGSREFVTTLERQAGRRLRVLARGRPPKKPEAADHAGLPGHLFAG
jgi:hypothetical protein